MKGKIIILLSLLLLSISSYSYASDCQYVPGCGISMSEFLAGKCCPVKTIAAHDPEPEQVPGYRLTKTEKKWLARPRPKNYNWFSKQGYGVGVIKKRRPDGLMHYHWEVSLPCFYTNTATGNTPCKRGRFKR